MSETISYTCIYINMKRKSCYNLNIALSIYRTATMVTSNRREPQTLEGKETMNINLTILFGKISDRRQLSNLGWLCLKVQHKQK